MYLQVNLVWLQVLEQKVCFGHTPACVAQVLQLQQFGHTKWFHADLCSDGGKDTTSAQVCPTGNAPATGSAPAYTANFCPIIQPLVNSNLGCYLGGEILIDK